MFNRVSERSALKLISIRYLATQHLCAAHSTHSMQEHHNEILLAKHQNANFCRGSNWQRMWEVHARAGPWFIDVITWLARSTWLACSTIVLFYSCTACSDDRNVVLLRACAPSEHVHADLRGRCSLAKQRLMSSTYRTGTVQHARSRVLRLPGPQ